ncbi:hypothetical protein KI387_018498, partial [Taxus chinensis]
LLQATHDELKKADLALTKCTAPEELITVKTLEEENEVHKVMKDASLGHAECLDL